ncbi:MAG: hypothetical protein Q9184_003088 [Pyrenodesmia sp. 2 TL-2023]
MRYDVLALLFLSIPPLLQAGPVQSIDHNTSNFNRSDVDFHLRELVVRAEDEADADAEGDGCDTIESCKAAGQKLWNALQDKLKDNDAKDLEGYDDLFKQKYIDKVTRDTSPDASAWRDLFRNLNIDYKDHFAEHVVTGVEDEFQAYDNMFNTNQGVMVSPWNFKRYDTKRPVPFAEVIFQCFKNECDEKEELKLFQLAAIENVVNEQYLKVIKEIYELRGKNKMAERWEKWTYENNQDDFITLLGTPKLSFLLRMLADHSVAFGKRIPIEFWENYRLRHAYVVVGKYEG